MYRLGEMVVHPLHGAGRISDIVKKTVDGCERIYYVLSIESGAMSVMVPQDKSREIGLRPVMGKREAERVFRAIPDMNADCPESNWNKRYKENMLRIKSGDPMEVACVVKGLMLREGGKGLSTGERKMLRYAKDILISEMILSLEQSTSEIESKLTLAVS